MTDNDIEVEFVYDGVLVTALVEAGDPGEHTLWNGEPGYPPTGPTAEAQTGTPDCLEDMCEEVFDELFRESFLRKWKLEEGVKLTREQCQLIPPSWWNEVEERALEEAGYTI